MILALRGAMTKLLNVKDEILKILSFFLSFHILIMMSYALIKPFTITYLQDSYFGIETSLIIDILEDVLDLHLHGTTKYMFFICTTTLFFAMRMRRSGSVQYLFANISRLDADKSLIKFVKFLMNYGFYKFGIEIILVTILNLIWSKIDLLSLIYLPILIMFAFKKRQTLEKFCKFSCYFVLFLIIFQFFAIIYLHLCELNSNYAIGIWKEIFLILVGNLKETPSHLIYDYVLLMMLSCQLKNFEIAKTLNFSLNPFQHGGENDSIVPPKMINNEKIYKHPIYVLPEKIETFMDLLKRYVFKIQYWITIALIFFAGTQTYRVDILSLCYIVWSFVFLWQGTEFYIKPFRQLSRQWNLLMTYNIIAIILKVSIKLMHCVKVKIAYEEFCHILVIFDLPCKRKSSTSCEDLDEKNEIFWDILVFALIIIQKRIFLSYYFYNIIQDTTITNMMVSRGAKLVEELRIQEMNRSLNEEKAYLENLRLKMDKIKKTAAIRNEKRSNIKSHDIAIRTGNIFMFGDEFEDTKGEANQDMNIKSTTIMSPNELQDESFFDIEVLSEKSKEQIFIKKEKKSKKFVLFFQRIFEKLHARSKNHTYIIKLLSQEKKSLKDALSPLEKL